jgi:hypothetical protein
MDLGAIQLTVSLGTLGAIVLGSFHLGRKMQRVCDRMDQHSKRLDKIEARCDRLHPPMALVAKVGGD